MKQAILFWTLVLAPAAFAEYRAFKLEISKKESEERREVISTLDDIQYPTYFPLHEGEVIRYLDSWMCFGRTNERPICMAPIRPTDALFKNTLPTASPALTAAPSAPPKP